MALQTSAKAAAHFRFLMDFLRKSFIIFLFLGPVFSATAQRPYFVYLQTETQEPFFVQLNKKNQSSSTVGHLILSGLVNGAYDISLGFPGQNVTQQYSLTINGTDKGYLVKKFENGSWGLVDLQTSETQLSGEFKQAAEKAEIEKAIALANAKRVEEEALKAEQARAELAKADSLKALEKSKEAQPVPSAGATVATAAVVSRNDTPGKDSSADKTTEKTEEKAVENQVAASRGTVTTTAANTGNAGVATTAVVTGTLSAAEIFRLQEEARRIDAQGKRDSALKAQKTEAAPAKTATAAPVFLDMEITMPADSLKGKADTAVVAPVVVKATPADTLKAEAAPPKNPNCTAEATDADIEMMTMLIKGEKAAEDALEMARKGMKIKCVQTAQVRKLALLFEGQEDRYRLLDMAYRYTVDRQHYGSLSDLLTDSYFLNRFKAMLQ